MKICTMWDDGLESDLPLIEALNDRGIIASFALSPGRYKPDVREPNHPKDPYYGKLISHSDLCHYEPHDIVSHGWTHPDFTKLPGYMLDEQLSKSQYRLQEWFGKPVLMLCYPFGQTNADVVKFAAKYYAGARSLPPYSKDWMWTPNSWTDPLRIWPTAHWGTENLVERLLNQSKTIPVAMLWGHTYEFQKPGDLQRILAMYDALMAKDCQFVSFKDAFYAARSNGSA